MPRIFTSNFSGLANRLEGLTLSFAIQKAYGHDIYLDWPELDAFDVIGASRRKMRPWNRIGSLKLSTCDDAQFQTLGRYRTILQRVIYTPPVTQPFYLETARRIRPHEPYINTLEQTFAPFRGRPVVGVHIRGGDFALVDEQTYDITRARHQAVPMWWYEHVMRQYRSAFPDVAFLLCHSGDPARFAAWRQEFDTFELPVDSSFQVRSEHQSASHPIADLFALACCNVIIATPNSSFSHFAANALGHPAISILPPPQMSALQPRFGMVQLYGQRLRKWVGAVSNGEIFRLAADNDLPMPQPAHTEWLRDPTFLPA